MRDLFLTFIRVLCFVVLERKITTVQVILLSVKLVKY